ncbi:MAG: N-acetyltransferase [Firmicutes bacterium]|nr:N-acetyltransferase [Bacillota bacterium]
MTIRKARITDVENIQQLVNNYADKGLMLPRSLSMLYESLREFMVAEDINISENADGSRKPEILGTGALHVIWSDLAEIRALAVAPHKTGTGIGRRLVESLLAEARDLGIPYVFALTYQPVFFEKCGFTRIEKEQLPQKVWKDCINCPRFPNCDEVALIIKIPEIKTHPGNGKTFADAIFPPKGNRPVS